MRYLKVTNQNRNDKDFGKKYTFTSIADYLRWDREGFEEFGRDLGACVDLSDEVQLKALADRVEFQLPSNFYADSTKPTFNFVDEDPLRFFGDMDDFQAVYNLICDTMAALF